MSKDVLAMALNYVVGTLSMIMGFAALYMIIFYGQIKPTKIGNHIQRKEVIVW